MTKTTLSVQNLTKKIGKRQIIKGISFELQAGEVFGFLGPNGAGKTTTIRMLVGLIKPTSGSMVVCGYNVRTHFTKAMEKIGCIVENPELYPYLTGKENLLHFARMLPNIPETRITEVVAMVGLEARIDEKVKTYSLGMRQRLGIAQAMLNHPKVLILDEPTNGLDPAGIREMRQFIRELAEQEGLSVLVSSHLLGEIQLLCDRVAIIKNGEIIQVDSVKNLLSSQEKMLWKVDPMERGKAVLTQLTDVSESTDGYLVTAFEEKEIPKWNVKLINEGISVLEMNRKLPALEDLFLEVTGVGGSSIE
ncbi:ABC transporter ATP-binding protein [Peribacillus psychrosaccharolyticus]|uniref:ABC transporter ATP-binding protein n=1 Tax=Peribacillus psychrosaccharolyticus TaxID=1407 RepID=A0A974S091_PERPY|nr:ABC transporter ATP-binding protein [Peribacillus psychrosaccharolyticus]MEC2056461.1 ABC transporter ATP-binding protein [Peribacillus psychrosaccharolyticus]MED3745403.1 ABC transporter ATP-binding protein [Peribacillus psychrosaccharolyticus]QQT00387.1 ABC transporter ATP-binding protein [Peribacillus psychrosaccharolyticus]